MNKPALSLAVLAICAAVSGCMTPTRSSLMQVDKNGDNCIPNSEFSIAGVAMDMSEAQLISKLGTPVSRKPVPKILDLPYEEIFTYNGLEVYLADKQVMEFSATNPNWSTPSGIQPGLTRMKLLEILGSTPDIVSKFDGETRYSSYFCASEEQVYVNWLFVFSISQGGLVRAVEIQRDWP